MMKIDTDFVKKKMTLADVRKNLCPLLCFQNMIFFIIAAYGKAEGVFRAY